MMRRMRQVTNKCRRRNTSRLLLRICYIPPLNKFLLSFSVGFMPVLTLHSDLWADGGEVLSYMMGLTALRFTVSGIVNTWLRDVPCLFQVFSKGLAGAQQRKLHENLWYAIWHTVRYVCISTCMCLHGLPVTSGVIPRWQKVSCAKLMRVS